MVFSVGSCAVFGYLDKGCLHSWIEDMDHLACRFRKKPSACCYAQVLLTLMQDKSMLISSRKNIKEVPVNFHLPVTGHEKHISYHYCQFYPWPEIVARFWILALLTCIITLPQPTIAKPWESRAVIKVVTPVMAKLTWYRAGCYGWMYIHYGCFKT